MVADLIDRLVAAARADPGMHVYHYAPYEVTALKKLTGGYGVREAELDQLLREERFVDLYPVVRQSMRISKESYSIKKVEAFYGRSHEGAVASGLGSVLDVRAVAGRPRRSRSSTTIESYNKDDVDSTRELHEWLEQQRAELEALHGPQPRPVADRGGARPRRSATSRPPSWSWPRGCTTPGTSCSATSCSWHRREDRPAWWEVFRLTDAGPEALIADGTALGGLSEPVDRGAEKRSQLYEYSFPVQDTKLSAGDDALDVDTAKKVGTVFELDAAAGRLVLKTTAAEPPRPRGLGPGGPLNTKSLREAIQATGEDVLAGRDCLGQALVERRVPAGTQLREGESTTEAIVRLGLALDGEVLAIQGPPGSGKTTAAAELIRELLDAGKKVGVTATSHAVIGNLLKAVGRPALQKCDESQHCGSDDVAWSSDNAVVTRKLLDGDVNLVGGTAWFWTRADVAQAVDVLVVDEAGQFSLANAVAVARGARSMVLLGDPQQLAQPSQAVHPGESGASALEHLLDGHATIPPERGVFLDRSYRMHPDLTAFVSDLAYEGRLEAAAGRERVAVLGEGRLSGSGLRVHPVRHILTAADKSQQEADVVARLWQSVQGSTWRNHLGEEARIGAGAGAGRRAVQRAGRADQGGAARRCAGRDRGQVPGPGGAGGHLLDDQHQRRRRTPRRLVPLRPQPAERGGVAGAGAGRRRAEPAAARRAGAHARAAAAGERALPAGGVGDGGRVARPCARAGAGAWSDACQVSRGRRRGRSARQEGGLVAGSGEVLLEVDGGVAIVTLNAPDRRNALTPAMADELIATFDEVDAKPEVGALVIRAVGKSFCAGGDIATLTVGRQGPGGARGLRGHGEDLRLLLPAGAGEGADGGRGARFGGGRRHEHAAGGGPADRGAGRPADLRVPQARDAPGRRALRDPVAADRPRGRGGDGAVRRGDQRRQGRRARAGVGVGGRRRGRGPGAGAGRPGGC